MRMIVNRNVLAVDTDSITDPIERKWMTMQGMSPRDKEVGMEREMQTQVADLYARAQRDNKWLCLVGLSMGHITNCELGFVIQVDPLRHWKQYNGRTLASLLKHGSKMMRDIEMIDSLDKVDGLLNAWSVDYEIRGPFVKMPDVMARWYSDNERELRAYRVMNQSSIANEINRLGMVAK